MSFVWANYQIDKIAIKKLVKYTKKLSFLRLDPMQGIAIDMYDYKAMLKSVQSHPEKMKLAIKVIGKGDKVYVSEEMMNENLRTVNGSILRTSLTTTTTTLH